MKYDGKYESNEGFFLIHISTVYKWLKIDPTRQPVDLTRTFAEMSTCSMRLYVFTQTAVRSRLWGSEIDRSIRSVKHSCRVFGHTTFESCLRRYFEITEKNHNCTCCGSITVNYRCGFRLAALQHESRRRNILQAHYNRISIRRSLEKKKNRKHFYFSYAKRKRVRQIFNNKPNILFSSSTPYYSPPRFTLR